MKVLHFYKTYYPEEYGGVQEVIRQLAEGGRAYGWEAEILALTPGRPGTIEMDGYRVHRVKRLFKAASTDFAFRALAEFRRLAAGADLVHYHFPYPLADVAHFWAAHRKPCLVSYHSDIVAQKKLLFFYQPLMNRFLQSVPVIVAASPNYMASSPILRALAEKTRCIPLGISPPPPAPALTESWRKRLPERFFLFVGAFRYYKGLDFLLTAVKGLSIPVVLVGEGGQEPALKARVAAEGLDNVHFTGALPDEDKEALLSLCGGLILPSHMRSEAFGLSLLDGARHGKPLVCCEIATGTTYINVHNETGLVVPPADPAALRGALLNLWNDSDLAARLGAGARRRFEKMFTVEKMVRAYMDLYDELLEQPRQRATVFCF
jgi:rhamnosyl/mannosyltransferase